MRKVPSQLHYFGEWHEPKLDLDGYFKTDVSSSCMSDEATVGRPAEEDEPSPASQDIYRCSELPALGQQTVLRNGLEWNGLPALEGMLFT